MTSKETFNIALWYEKQAEKHERKARSIFSQEEKNRVERCSDGPATEELKSIVFNYIIKYFEDDDCVLGSNLDWFKKNRPCTDTVFYKSATIEQRILFNSDEPYWNMYFASWWIKKNWNNMVDEIIEYRKNTDSFKVLC